MGFEAAKSMFLDDPCNIHLKTSPIITRLIHFIHRYIEEIGFTLQPSFGDVIILFFESLGLRKDTSEDTSEDTFWKHIQKTYDQYATTIVQETVSAIYRTGGKNYINRIATTSITKSIYGAAANSHVSRTIRRSLFSNLVMLVYNITELLFRRFMGDISWEVFAEELIQKVMARVGGLLGGAIGACTAASLLCNPITSYFLVSTCSVVGSKVLDQSAVKLYRWLST